MSKGPDTTRQGSKERMIEATAKLLQRQGYHATGLNQIVREAGAPKGSLYFHFPDGKEGLALAALACSGNSMQKELLEVVARFKDPADALQGVIDYFADHLEATGFLMGCPIATVALEAAATSDRLQAVCSKQYGEWEQQLNAYLRLHGLKPEDADDTAALVLAAIEGGLLLARAHRDVRPLRAAGRSLARLLRSIL